MITFEVTPMQLRSFVIRYIESQGLRGAVRFQIYGDGSIEFFPQDPSVAQHPRVVEFMSFLGRAVDPRNFKLFKQLFGSKVGGL